MTSFLIVLGRLLCSASYPPSLPLDIAGLSASDAGIEITVRTPVTEQKFAYALEAAGLLELVLCAQERHLGGWQAGKGKGKEAGKPISHDTGGFDTEDEVGEVVEITGPARNLDVRVDASGISGADVGRSSGWI